LPPAAPGRKIAHMAGKTKWLAVAVASLCLLLIVVPLVG